MTDKKKDTDDWMGILPDAERADVLKTQIKEEAETERARVEAVEQTKRSLINNDGHQWVRALTVIALAVVLCMAIGAWWSVNDPNPSTPRPSASAHAMPAKAP